MLNRSSIIRNLSIALEACSRCTGHENYTLYNELSEALHDQIQKFKEEQKEAYPTPSPIKPSPSTDDEIPF